MEPLLSLQTSIGEAFEVNWATCQQLADEGSQRDPTQIETPLNWPPERAGSSVEGMRLARTQKALWRQVVKARADKLDLKIRALHPANPVYMAMVMATKLNAQVIIKNLQNMHEKSLPPTGARRRMELAYQDWARLQGDHARADLSTAP